MLVTGIAVLALLLSAVTAACFQLSMVLLAGLWVLYFLVLALAALGFLWAVCRAVDLETPQEKDDPFYRAVMYVYIEALMNLVLVRLHTRGLEKTPKEGRFLLVCNHLFLADPGIVLHCFRKSQLAFLTKKENYDLPFVGKIMHKILCQPIDRENDRQSLKSILKCIQLIKEDQVSIGVFPEGYTSKDGKVHPFRAGAFKIAQKTGVPIVVCTIRGTRQIFKNLRKLKRTDVELHLVEVIQPERYKGLSTIQISDMVYETMISDLGEEARYVESSFPS